MANEQISVKYDFQIKFNVFLGDENDGGDGMAFVLHDGAFGADEVGKGGGGFGVAGIENGLALEIDTFQNGTDSIANDHTGWMDTDAVREFRQVSPLLDVGNVEDGAWHAVQVDWDAQDQILSYTFDGRQGASVTGDLAHKYFGGSDLVHFGFAGATGGMANRQMVQLVSLTTTNDVVDSTLSQAFAEMGTTNLTHEKQLISLSKSFENPVVVAYVATENGPQPVNVRVSSVSSNELILQLQEPDYLDGWHKTETVNYLVVETGSWVLPNGTLVEAGTLTSNKLSPQGFETVAFDAAFDAAPVVLSQVQTFKGSDFVTTRQKAATADGFQVTMQEEEVRNSGFHVNETIGWIAVEEGGGNLSGGDWVAGRAAGVTDDNTTVDLIASMPDDAHVIAALSSYKGNNPAWTRGNGSTVNGFDISVEEDRSQDPETRHIPEMIDYFAFSGEVVFWGYDADAIV